MLHKHEHRLESWTIVEGTATIQIGSEVKEYSKNDIVSVPIGVAHRVSNLTDSNVIIIETGIGEIMGETEFERKKDTDFVNVDESRAIVNIPDIMKLEPAFKDNLWGGTKLRTVFGKKCDYDVIGESWELSAHSDGQSVIASGTFAGMYFGEFIEKYGEEVVGWKSSSLDRFPVLIKFIDAKMHFQSRFIRMMIMPLKMRMSSEKMRCGMWLTANRELIFIVVLSRMQVRKR